MDHWIKFGIISAILVAISDLFRKYLVSKIDPVITVLVPLSITGILSIIILLTNGYKNKIENIENKELCLLLLGGFMIPTSHYFITKTIQGYIIQVMRKQLYH